jgi:hypothetical protein
MGTTAVQANDPSDDFHIYRQCKRTKFASSIDGVQYFTSPRLMSVQPYPFNNPFLHDSERGRMISDGADASTTSPAGGSRSISSI